MNGAGSHKPGTKAVALLLMSVCLNLALATVAVRELRQPPRPASRSLTNLVSVTIRTQPTIATDLPATVFVTNRFHWQQLESTNYDEYVGNLRAMGCPEKTVRDIILADLAQSYRRRRAQLKQEQPFWLGGKQKRIADRARDQQLTALELEEADTARRLVGVEWVDEPDRFGRHVAQQALIRFVFGPMPEESHQRVSQLVEKYQALTNQRQRRNRGIATDEDDAEELAQNRAMEREIAAVLGPARMEELTARVMAMDLFEHLAAETLDLTPAEARQIALARVGRNGVFAMFDHAAAKDEAEEALYQNRVAALLGEKRFAEFQRAQDGDFRNLLLFTTVKELPKETAIAVYDLRRLAFTETERIVHDASLDKEGRQQRLAEMQTQVQRAVRDALGQKAYDEYRQHAGDWLDLGQPHD